MSVWNRLLILVIVLSAQIGVGWGLVYLFRIPLWIAVLTVLMVAIPTITASQTTPQMMREIAATTGMHTWGRIGIIVVTVTLLLFERSRGASDEVMLLTLGAGVLVSAMSTVWTVIQSNRSPKG